MVLLGEIDYGFQALKLGVETGCAFLERVDSSDRGTQAEGRDRECGGGDGGAGVGQDGI